MIARPSLFTAFSFNTSLEAGKGIEGAPSDGLPCDGLLCAGLGGPSNCIAIKLGSIPGCSTSVEVKIRSTPEWGPSSVSCTTSTSSCESMFRSVDAFTCAMLIKQPLSLCELRAANEPNHTSVNTLYGRLAILEERSRLRSKKTWQGTRRSSVPGKSLRIRLKSKSFPDC